MKKSNTLVKIGWGIILCLFLIEYLHPSAVGVRVNCSLAKFYSSLECESPRPQKSEHLAWVRGDHEPLADNGPILFGKHSMGQKNIVHAMIWFFTIPIIRTFPKFKFQPIPDFLFNRPPWEKIYHPPRRPFLFLSV